MTDYYELWPRAITYPRAMSIGAELGLRLDAGTDQTFTVDAPLTAEQLAGLEPYFSVHPVNIESRRLERVRRSEDVALREVLNQDLFDDVFALIPREGRAREEIKADMREELKRRLPASYHPAIDRRFSLPVG